MARATVEVRGRAVGPWPMNTYVLACQATGHSVLIDPGAEPDTLLMLLDGTTPQAILLTHGHPDHIGALEETRQRLGVPVMAHAGPHPRGVVIPTDRALTDGDTIPLGKARLRVHATPGHTLDMLSYVVEGDWSVIVGDTIFDGGPGKTWSPDEFQQTLRALRDRVLVWPDEAVCYPGHGPSFRLGDRRAVIERFLARDHGDFYGDATWEM